MQEHLHFFLISFLFAGFISLMAFRKGFFQLPAYPRFAAPTLRNMFTAFALFLAIELLIVPALAGFYLLSSGAKLTPLVQGWFSLLAIYASAFGLILYSSLFCPLLASAKGVKNLLAGAAVWILSYPWVVVIGHLVAVIFLLVGPLPHAEQVAVKQLKISSQHPALFASMIFAIVFLVPVVEELLFRGFLQGSLVPYLGRIRAILVASIIFAFFHFSTSQGWDNVELILSLFILSCYLGLIYEKRGSLWAPVGLHMMFNALSVAAIIWQEGTLT